MWKKNRKRVLALGLTFSIIIGMAGCGKEEQMKAETNPDTPVSEVQFPLKEKAEIIIHYKCSCNINAESE